MVAQWPHSWTPATLLAALIDLCICFPTRKNPTFSLEHIWQGIPQVKHSHHGSYSLLIFRETQCALCYVWPSPNAWVRKVWQRYFWSSSTVKVGVFPKLSTFLVSATQQDGHWVRLFSRQALGNWERVNGSVNWEMYSIMVRCQEKVMFHQGR